MAETVITTPYIDYVQSVKNNSIKDQPNMYGLKTDYAVSNKWIGYVPLENVLGKKYKNLELHLTNFTLPQQEMTSSVVSYKGYQKEIPTKIMNALTKQLTLEYIVDAKWTNYKSLYAWMSSILGNINPVIVDNDIQSISPSSYIPIRIYLLDQYKRKIVSFLFENCWIKLFNDLSLACNSADEIHHSFVMCYDKYSIEDVELI